MISSKCPHWVGGRSNVTAVNLIFGKFMATCGSCSKTGPWDSSPLGAIQKFWEADDRDKLRDLAADVINRSYQTLQEKFMEHKNTYYIVVSDEGPADKPRRHNSRDEAKKEADRLTKNHPGIEFTIFQAVSAVRTPKAEPQKIQYCYPEQYSYYYKTRDGRVTPAGPRFF